LWIFGWDRLNRYAHLALIWVVTLTAYASAYFILIANGFLSNPVGYLRVGDELRIASVGALFTNPAALLPLGHILAGAFLTVGFFMAGISAWHLRRSHEPEFYRRALRIGLVSVILAILPSAVFGAVQFPYRHDASGVEPLTDQAYLTMLLTWVWMFLVAAIALVKLPFTRWLLRGRIFLRMLMMTLPMPYVAMLAGWLFRETGRQPWLIHGVLRTEDAMRPVGPGAMVAVFVGVTALFAALVVINVALLRRYARRGPDGAALGGPEPGVRPEPVPSF
jgi:cytochrome bd ubiquinol oxidase subunit I